MSTVDFDFDFDLQVVTIAIDNCIVGLNCCWSRGGRLAVRFSESSIDYAEIAITGQ